MGRLPVYMKAGKGGRTIEVDVNALARHEFGRGLWRLRLSGFLFRLGGLVLRARVDLQPARPASYVPAPGDETVRAEGAADQGGQAEEKPPATSWTRKEAG